MEYKKGQIEADIEAEGNGTWHSNKHTHTNKPEKAHFLMETVSLSLKAQSSYTPSHSLRILRCYIIVHNDNLESLSES